MRDDYTYPRPSTCIGGINEQVETASPIECSDALNVWARPGHVTKRPGYVGVSSIYDIYHGSNPLETSLAPAILIKETPVGTFAAIGTNGNSLNLSNLPVNSRWYLGFTVTPTNALGITFNVIQSNSNASRFMLEYYNGTTWVRLNAVEYNNINLGHLYGGPPAQGAHLYAPFPGSNNSAILFVGPRDFAQTTVTVSGTDYTRYYLRFTVQDVALDASVEIDNNSFIPFSLALAGPTISGNIRGLFVSKFPSTKRYLNLVNFPVNDTRALAYLNADRIDWSTGVGITSSGRDIDEPATMAVLPEFDEAYMAYGNKVTVHKAYPTGTDDIIAHVEARPEIVGPNAKYSTNYIAQLGEFPKAKYITYFKGFLWASGIEGDPHGVRWTAPEFAYKVWPLISRESVAESDNSGTTAQYGFGESLIVWKNDSMWQMQFVGTNAFGLAEFKAQRVPGGVGCVSQASIVEIHGKIYWLAEDGVYYFDGVQVRPLFKDKIQSVFNRINPSRRAYAVGVNWSPNNVYLLSIAVDGATNNNLVLVYDYSRKAWWIWNDIEAQFWLPDEDSADNFTLYFGDSSGRIYELGKGLTDHGAAIESYIVTNPLARAPIGGVKTLRVASILSNNLSRSVTIEARADDAASGPSKAASYTDYNEVEYGEAISGDEYVPNRMRTRSAKFREDGGHFRIKVSHSEKNAPWDMHGIQIGYEMKGRRR